MKTTTEMKNDLRGVKTPEDFKNYTDYLWGNKDQYGFKTKNDMYLCFIYLLVDKINQLERMV